MVFDGYSSSTKKHEHRRRSKIFSTNIEITENTPVTVSRSNVLANRRNKSSLTKLLARYLIANGLMAKLSCEDADTLVTETALECCESGSVNVYATDTDVLIMLIYHIQRAKFPAHFTAAGKAFDVKPIFQNLTQEQRNNLLIAHSFSVYDTVTSIYGWDKIRLFNKICGEDTPTEALKTLTLSHSNKTDVNAGVQLLVFFYAIKTYQIYHQHFLIYVIAILMTR